MQRIRIRITSPSTDDETVYNYRQHKILPVPRSDYFTGEYELLIEAEEINDDPVAKIVLLVHQRKGTEAEMKELWATAFGKARSTLYTRGIEFNEM